MYQDMFGAARLRLGLHHHSTASDGALSPEAVAAHYKTAGYDAIAITDHWVYSQAQVLSGLPILPGCEYNVGTNNAKEGVYHIVCLCADTEPAVTRNMSVQQIIDRIHRAGGLAVLAHPAWSLNTPENIRQLKGIDAAEIFNTVSDRGMSRRADSSLIVDMLATDGIFFPLLAADDSHYYGTGNFADACNAFIMVQCDSTDPQKIRQAIRNGQFYASTGPEIHLTLRDGIAHVDCSPASEIVFMSNLTFSSGRIATGTGLTGADYEPKPGEAFLRAYVTDAQGQRAWTNCISLL